MNSKANNPVLSFIKKAFFDWFISKPSILFGIAVVCIMVVAMPKSYQKYFGYDEIIKPYRGFISLAGLASGVLWLVTVFTKLIALIYPPIVKKWKQWRFDKKAPDILRNLTAQEKSYLAKYITKDVSTLDFMFGDGVINGLRRKGVVYQASSVSKQFDYFDFNLQPWVLKTVEKYSDLKDDILKHYEPERQIL
jgi:hypothetical protein